MNARIGSDGWIRCAACGHKLGKIAGEWTVRQSFPAIEIKCHSCKELNYIFVGGQKGSERVEKRETI